MWSDMYKVLGQSDPSEKSFTTPARPEGRGQGAECPDMKRQAVIMIVNIY